MTTDRSSRDQAEWTSGRLIERREAICARFENALRLWARREGELPRSEEYLAKVPDSHRWQILQCLLLLEEDYRRQAGESGSLLDEFRARFPDFTAQIDRAFSKQDPSTVTQIRQDTAHGLSGQVREYELQEILGQGGMGMVWKAWHVRLKTHRAIKVLHAHMHASPEVRDRFLNEMEALARFEHANIVKAHDAFEEDGQLYLVMEYVEGLDVNRLVDRYGRMPVGAACEIVHQAAKGLAALHDQHVTHRDIKPSNLMVTHEPDSKRLVVKVMDLGLSQVDSERGLTHSGDVFGTCEFMAPEQYDDCRDLTPAADVYSLGCSFFFLLTGKPPYTAEGSKGARAVKLMLDHQNAPIPQLDEICPEAAGLQPLLDRMMAKKPGERFASALQLLDELESFADQSQLQSVLGERPAEGPSCPPRRERLKPERTRRFRTRRLLTWGVVAVVLVAAVALGVAKLSVDASQRRLKELHLQAASVASDYGKEIERRLSMLRIAARDPKLRDLLAATGGAAVGSREFAELNTWLENAKFDSGLTPTEQESTTWFITDATGRQVAREPHGSSLGKTGYWTRSYFHGMPIDLDADVDDPSKVSPIREETVSAPYLSTSEHGKWKIAFSTPIFAATGRDTAEPIGVLSMSVRLENLTWFQAAVDNSAIALVELYRENWLDDDLKGQTRIGQVIDHTDLFAALIGEDAEADPFCVAPELVTQLQELRAQRLKAFLRQETRSLCDLCVSKTYLDPVSANPTASRRAAFEPVFVPGASRSLTNIGWLVIVDDFYPADRHADR